LSDRHGISASDVLVDDEGRVWGRVVTADPPYWLSLRTLPETDPVAGLAIAFWIALLAVLVGGIALQRRIAVPLNRFEETVGRMSNPFDAHDSDIARPREMQRAPERAQGLGLPSSIRLQGRMAGRWNKKEAPRPSRPVFAFRSQTSRERSFLGSIRTSLTRQTCRG